MTLIEVLKTSRPYDEEGEETIVSRHAVDEAIATIAQLRDENARLTEQLHALSRTVMSDQVSNDSHSLFIAAIRDLAAINEALELDPDDGGAVPIIDAIDELKATIAQQADQLAAAERDAERYRWLRDATGETPIRPAAFNSEIMPDIRLKFDFPTLVSYNCIGVQYTLDEAIDAAIAAQKGEK